MRLRRVVECGGVRKTLASPGVTQYIQVKGLLWRGENSSGNKL